MSSRRRGEEVADDKATQKHRATRTKRCVAAGNEDVHPVSKDGRVTECPSIRPLPSLTVHLHAQVDHGLGRVGCTVATELDVGADKRGVVARAPRISSTFWLYSLDIRSSSSCAATRSDEDGEVRRWTRWMTRPPSRSLEPSPVQVSLDSLLHDDVPQSVAEGVVFIVYRVRACIDGGSRQLWDRQRGVDESMS